jgi:hypothetical protein
MSSLFFSQILAPIRKTIMGGGSVSLFVFHANRLFPFRQTLKIQTTPPTITKTNVNFLRFVVRI